MSTYAFALLGGDFRIAWLAQLLADDGHIVKLYAQEENDFPFNSSIIHCCDAETAITASDACILGIPCSRDKLTVYAPFSRKSVPFTTLLPLLSENQYLFGGMLPIQHERAIDYSLDESYLWANTLPTAEGALQLLMEHLPCVVSGCRIAVIGYGRVAQTTANLLRNVGAYVTVFARDSVACTKAELFGFSSRSLHSIHEEMASFHAVLNTVPAPIFTSDILQHVSAHTLFMELASSPGGFDVEAVKRYQLHYIPAGGLPGKVAPQTAALYIKNTIIQRLEELL